MAKVYDALKQVEAERSRQLQAEARAARSLESRDEPKFWRRWSERLTGNGEEQPAEARLSSRAAAPLREPVAVAPDPAVRQRIEAILGRLDALEGLAKERLPEMERNLLDVLEGRMEMVERELGSSVSTLGRQMREEIASLHRRIGILLGAVTVLTLALLLG